MSMNTQSQNNDVAAALFTFMGWLTTRDTTVRLGSVHDASEAADLVQEFCDRNGIRDPDMATNPYKHPEPTQ